VKYTTSIDLLLALLIIVLVFLFVWPLARGWR
jgi:hypothetical protein